MLPFSYNMSSITSPLPYFVFEMWRISSLITLMFTLAISCLTTSNLPWFMNLTFQVPMQYGSLQHQALLSPPDTSTTEHCFCFGPVASLFLGLLVVVLHSSPVAYWTPSDLEDSYSGDISFWLFMGFSWQEYWSGLPSPPSVDYILSELFTMTCTFWMALHVMAHSFIGLCKPLRHKAVIHEGEFWFTYI